MTAEQHETASLINYPRFQHQHSFQVGKRQPARGGREREREREKGEEWLLGGGGVKINWPNDVRREEWLKKMMSRSDKG